MEGLRPSEGGLRRRRMPLRRVSTVKKGVPGTGSVGVRAMRYYRLWIYTCNTALLAGTLAFCIAAAKTLVLDFRRALVPSLTLYQPSFLYAYLALATQGGAIQLLGCLAAVRLSEKMLNAYWLLLLVLLFGDVVLGAFWAFRFERLCQDLKPSLRLRFHHEYGNEAAMTALWDRLQNEDSCCGINGPSDFVLNTTLVSTPESCCSELSTTNTTTKCLKPHPAGCEDKVLAYVKNTASLLAILGYCVLAFLKLCFLGILRYEIREMIQKIRLLKTELELSSVNGAVPGSIRAEATESERESLLVRPESVAMLSSPPTHSKNPNGNNNYELREYRSHENLRLM